ncbi:MAG: pirin family protein [Erysipelotrichaceae bacterium]
MKKYSVQTMGSSRLSWLQSLHHFSFSDYYNPARIQYGVLRVVNDDIVDPKQGFPMHPHADMEILSYVLEGALTHVDSMGHSETLRRGDLQYMSAGSGVAHSEYNLGDTPLRFLQIWIVPDKKGVSPQYGGQSIPWEKREHQWLQLVSSWQGEAPVRIHQDLALYVSVLDERERLSFQVANGRQAYGIVLEGSALINHVRFEPKEAFEIQEEDFEVIAQSKCHVMVLEMQKER